MSLTHFDAQGQAHMVDVGPKTTTHRIAVASGEIQMLPATLALIESGNAKKGDVIGIARIAGIQAAKKTSDLIPLCHPLALTRVALDFEIAHNPPSVRCTATHSRRCAMHASLHSRAPPQTSAVWTDPISAN